jgi:hypothetical protein
MSALRRIGATVQTLHVVGVGCPDIVVGFRGQNFLIEIKDGNKPPSKRRLTPDEAIWHTTWNGQVEVVISPEEAIKFVTESVA